MSGAASGGTRNLRRLVAAAALAAVALAADPAMAAPGEVRSWTAPAEPREIVATVRRLAPSYRLDPALVTAIIAAESGFDPGAISPANAVGLMQLMPETARRFGVADRRDPMQNLHGGMTYLRWLSDRFAGDTGLMLAAYNAGEGAVLRHGGIPPYRETEDYVAKVRRSVAGGDILIPSRASAAHRFLPIVQRGAARAGAPPAAEIVTVGRARARVLVLRGSGPAAP